MLEQPERYSEAQWQEILADDECRELYTLMAKVKSTAPPPEVSGETIDAEWQRLAQSQRPRAAIIPLWRKVAATAAIALVLFGVSYAAVKTGFFGLQKQTTEETAAVKPEAPAVTADAAPDAIEQATDTLTVMAEPRLYDNVPLEQMLAELAAYYHVARCVSIMSGSRTILSTWSWTCCPTSSRSASLVRMANSLLNQHRRASDEKTIYHDTIAVLLGRHSTRAAHYP